MATPKEYVEYILEQLDLLEEVTARSMMGEYLLYYKGQLFGGIYDSRLLIKITKTNKDLLENPEEQIPYQGAKPMLFMDEMENKELLKQVVIRTCEELPIKKK